MIGTFEGIGSERGIAWRLADSLSVRRFVGVGLDQTAPDHSTISRTRRKIDHETHQEVFTFILKILAENKLIDGTTLGVDSTTLEANAALRNIVRRDTGEPHAPGLSPRSALDKLSAIKLVDVEIPTTDGRLLILPRYTEPEAEQLMVLEKLALRLPGQPPPRIRGGQVDLSPTSKEASV